MTRCRRRRRAPTGALGSTARPPRPTARRGAPTGWACVLRSTSPEGWRTCTLARRAAAPAGCLHAFKCMPALIPWGLPATRLLKCESEGAADHPHGHEVGQHPAGARYDCKDCGALPRRYCASVPDQEGCMAPLTNASPNQSCSACTACILRSVCGYRTLAWQGS